MLAPQPTERLTIREAAGRLLARRPDLSSQRPQRKLARQVADSVGMRAAPVDVLAGWLGNSVDADVRDLEIAMEDRVQLKLASLAPRERVGADVPEFRARLALDLGWEALRGQAPRELLRVLAAAGGGPLPREVAAEAAGVGNAVVQDLVWSGFARQDEAQDLLSTDSDVIAHLAAQRDPGPAAADRHLRLALVARRHLAFGPLEDDRLDRAASLAVQVADAATEPGLVASLAHRMAERLRRRGHVPEAGAWLDLALSAAAHPPARPLLGLLELDRGLLALQEGRTEAALASFEEAVAELERARQDERGGADEALERARLCLGETLAACGRLDRAEELLRQVVERLGDRHRDPLAPGGDAEVQAARSRSLRSSLAHASRALGRVLLLRGDISSALVLLHEAQQDWQDLAGTAHPDGAAFALALAGALRAAGRFSEVEEPLEAARVLSGGDMDRPAQPTLPIALHDLGVAAGDRGDHAAAATLLDEATMLAGSLVGRDDEILARISYTRGLLFLAEGKLDRAQDKFETVLEWKLPGGDAAESLRALAHAALAWTRSREGAHRHHEAERVLAEAEDALSIRRGAMSTITAHIRILRESLRE